MTTRSATVTLGVATFACTAVLLVVSIVRTVIFGIWAGVLGVSSTPPQDIGVLWSSVATLGWTLLVLPLLFAGLFQMVRLRPSGPRLVAVAAALAVVCGLYTGISWGLEWAWGCLLVIPFLTTVFASLPGTRRLPEDQSLDTGA